MVRPIYGTGVHQHYSSMEMITSQTRMQVIRMYIVFRYWCIHAKSKSYYKIRVSDACISSSVLPFVSGTNLATNRTVKPPIPEKKKNVPAMMFVNIFYFRRVNSHAGL